VRKVKIAPRVWTPRSGYPTDALPRIALTLANLTNDRNKYPSIISHPNALTCRCFISRVMHIPYRLITVQLRNTETSRVRIGRLGIATQVRSFTG
jgi:hypothetical protein